MENNTNKTQTTNTEAPKAVNSTETKASANKPAAAAVNTKPSFDKKKKFFRNKGPRRNSMGDNFEERVVKTKRINKTTKGGRRMRFSALVIVGDKNGKVGYGIGKSVEVPNAVKKAIKNARKNIVNVPMTKTHTVHHEIIGHKGASRVLLKPAKEGTGIIAGGVIRDVMELAGYRNIYTKNLGSNTPLNMVIAIINGLRKQLVYSKVRIARDLVRKEDKSSNTKPVQATGGNK